MMIPRTIHYGLRSQDDRTLVMPRTKKNTLGDRAYEVDAPKLMHQNYRTHYPKMCATTTMLVFYEQIEDSFIFRIAYA